MSARKLQAGETLRIRSGGHLLVLRASTAWEVRIVKRNLGIRIKRSLFAWWLRMHRLGAAAGRRFVRAQRERAHARLLAELDERTLKDIGLESHNGNSLARRIAAYRHREVARILEERL